MSTFKLNFISTLSILLFLFSNLNGLEKANAGYEIRYQDSQPVLIWVESNSIGGTFHSDKNDEPTEKKIDEFISKMSSGTRLLAKLYRPVAHQHVRDLIRKSDAASETELSQFLSTKMWTIPKVILGLGVLGGLYVAGNYCIANYSAETPKWLEPSFVNFGSSLNTVFVFYFTSKAMAYGTQFFVQLANPGLQKISHGMASAFNTVWEKCYTYFNENQMMGRDIYTDAVKVVSIRFSNIANLIYLKLNGQKSHDHIQKFLIKQVGDLITLYRKSFPEVDPWDQEIVKVVNSNLDTFSEFISVDFSEPETRNFWISEIKATMEVEDLDFQKNSEYYQHLLEYWIPKKIHPAPKTELNVVVQSPVRENEYSPLLQ